jgi:SAM-dependent methyltransferase
MSRKRREPEVHVARLQVPAGDYLLDNSSPQTGTRFSALAQIYDPGTVRHLSELEIRKGWRCLEIGAGAGTVASWLSDKVGPEGHVIATDIDTRFLKRPARGNLEIRQHNIVSDPLPSCTFDLIHLRLVLLHLPERENVLERLFAALKPGGWILAEEFDALSIRADSSINPSETSIQTFGLMHKVMTDRGIDLRFGRCLAGRLEAHGFIDVVAEGQMFMWRGASPGAEMYQANIRQLRGVIEATGLPMAERVDGDLNSLCRSDLMFPSPVMWSVRARRPCATRPT